MKNLSTLLLLLLIFFLPLSLSLPKKVLAIEDPLSVPNNKFGIHILFPHELTEAAELVNSSGGDWGYIIAPIQSGDRDLEKWQAFMDEAKRLHVIPIIRLATEGDYFKTSVWRKPALTDVLDFANFLNSLDWPVKNRYVVVFNEVNRADEWGGSVDSAEYANILSYAVTVFKSKSQDFFILSAGLDNASANTSIAMNQYDYMRRMNQAVPGIFSQIDGIASHSYPNPAFSQPPTTITTMSIHSFKYERQLAESLSHKKLPVFITETGWSTAGVSEEKRANYYKHAMQEVWSDDSIVTVIPFLLKAGAGPFKVFSFINDVGHTMQYEVYKQLPKQKGKPHMNQEPLQSVLASETQESHVPVRSFSKEEKEKKFSVVTTMTNAFEWIFKLN